MRSRIHYFAVAMILVAVALSGCCNTQPRRDKGFYNSTPASSSYNSAPVVEAPSAKDQQIVQLQQQLNDEAAARAQAEAQSRSLESQLDQALNSAQSKSSYVKPTEASDLK